jgi:O-methyltransferase
MGDRAPRPGARRHGVPRLSGRAAPVVKGRVEETLPERAPERISLLRLDTDWYESTRHELEHLYPRLSPGGILILDDYGCWQGAREATDEYFMAHPPRPFLARFNEREERVAIKPVT